MFKFNEEILTLLVFIETCTINGELNIRDVPYDQRVDIKYLDEAVRLGFIKRLAWDEIGCPFIGSTLKGLWYYRYYKRDIHESLEIKWQAKRKIGTK